MTKTHTILSTGYWFSSRSLGLLLHPYLTMRTIQREQFLQPLTYLPTVIWILGWVIGLILTRIGLILGLQNLTPTRYLGHILLFIWLWGTLFCTTWQIILLYLRQRFQQIRHKHQT